MQLHVPVHCIASSGVISDQTYRYALREEVCEWLRDNAIPYESSPQVWPWQVVIEFERAEDALRFKLSWL